MTIMTLLPRYFHIRLASANGDDEDNDATEPCCPTPKLYNRQLNDMFLKVRAAAAAARWSVVSLDVCENDEDSNAGDV